MVAKEQLPGRLLMRIVLDAPTPQEARGAVAGLLGDQPADVVSTAQLLVSEVVANAIEHGGGARVAVLERRARSLHVEVLDRVPTMPMVQLASSRRPRGRGMFLVATLAARWDAWSVGDGKAVWFEMRLEA